MLPPILWTNDTDVKGKGRVTICLQLLADPNPSIEITSATVASHISTGNSCSKQFNESEMDWRRGTRKRVEGMEPERRLSLTSKFNNSEEESDSFAEVESEKRRRREPVRRF
jgi:hypothetical protein